MDWLLLKMELYSPGDAELMGSWGWILKDKRSLFLRKLNLSLK